MSDVLTALLRWCAPAYLWVYDRCMQLGPEWGPGVLGFGPILLAIGAFLLKARTLDPWMGDGPATFAIFGIFALMGPLMHVGSKIVSEDMHKRRTGQWPANPVVGFDPKGAASPTMVWVEMVRDWAN